MFGRSSVKGRKMKETRGILRQKFCIELDMSKLQEYIADQVVKSIENIKYKHGKSVFDVDIDEFYFDDNEELVIKGTYDTAFKSWYCRATRYEPEEYGIEREYIGEDGTGILDELPEELRNMVSVRYVEEKDEDADSFIEY